MHTGRTILAIILIIIVIYIIYIQLNSQNQPIPTDPRMQEIEVRVRQTVREAGYDANFNLHYSTKINATKNKKDIYLCNTCISDDHLGLDKMTYVGLHEAAHVLSKSRNHSKEWKEILGKLLYKAAELGFLDPHKIHM